MSPAEIEQTKLTASFLNSLASGIVLAAMVAPYIAWGMGTAQPTGNWGNVVSLSGFGLVVGVVLHLLARRLLGGLK